MDPTKLPPFTKLAVLAAKLPAFTLAAALFVPCMALAGPADDALMQAVHRGDLAQMRAALAGRADSNLRLPDGSTPLAWAVESQNPDIVRLLLEHGAKPNGLDGTSASPLLVACQYGNAAILDMLLLAGADAKTAQPDGVTALALCAGTAPVAIVERLISAGAEVDKADEHGQTPLMWAAAKGRVENIQLLVQHGAQVNRKTRKGFTPLFFALKSGEPRAPVAVLEAGGDPDYVAPDGTSVVQMAMYQKAYSFADRMIERGANLTAFDRNGNQLLHAAVLAGDPALVKLLLAKGANPNALTGHSTVKMRFEVNFRSGDYEAPSRPPLLLAAEHGFVGVMRMLIDAGADAKYRAPDGTNIVLAAATSGKLDALKLALDLQPDANTTTAEGQTPLHLLLDSGGGAETEAMMKLLASRGARVDIKNRAGQTPADVARDAQTEAKTAFAAAFEKRTVDKL